MVEQGPDSGRELERLIDVATLAAIQRAETLQDFLERSRQGGAAGEGEFRALVAEAMLVDAHLITNLGKLTADLARETARLRQRLDELG
jgi:hypothetical protein